MINKILNCFHTLLIKDYRILKYIFVILAMVLVIEEFYIFLVIKPTYTSYENRELMGEDFPEIMVCPEPSFDLQALKSIGYQGPADYFRGRRNKRRTFNWAGNMKSKNMKKVLGQISTLKNCHSFKQSVWFNANTSLKAEYGMEMKLTKALFPYHRCCKIIVIRNNCQRSRRISII